MSENNTQTTNQTGKLSPELEAAKNSLTRLPILGPAVWLCARDEQKKHLFVSDVDALIMPAVILDQCRLYTRDGVPFSFFTWATVSDEVDARLRSGVAKIAPHEWQSGDHLWMVDMIAPFGHRDEMFKDLREGQLAGRKINALVPNAQGKFDLKEWAAA